MVTGMIDQLQYTFTLTLNNSWWDSYLIKPTLRIASYIDNLKLPMQVFHMETTMISYKCKQTR